MTIHESRQTGEQRTGRGSVPRHCVGINSQECWECSKETLTGLRVKSTELHLAGDIELKTNCPVGNKWIQFCGGIQKGILMVCLEYRHDGSGSDDTTMIPVPLQTQSFVGKFLYIL